MRRRKQVQGEVSMEVRREWTNRNSTPFIILEYVPRPFNSPTGHSAFRTPRSVFKRFVPEIRANWCQNIAATSR